MFGYVLAITTGMSFKVRLESKSDLYTVRPIANFFLVEFFAQVLSTGIMSQQVMV